MKILFYNWNDYSSKDAFCTLLEMGYEVAEIRYELPDKLNNEEFERQIDNAVKAYHFDVLFSFDYFPVLSKAAMISGLKYVSWVYDSPHFTLYSETVFNECNYIFCFDKMDVGRLLGLGVRHAYHMPLAVNCVRLERELGINAQAVLKVENRYDVSFVGSLYNDKYNFYDRIELPEYYRGFFDGLFHAQMELYGCDLASMMVTEPVFDGIKKYFSIEEKEGLFITPRECFIQFLQKKVTSLERVRLLKALSKRCEVTLFSAETDEALHKVQFRGTVDYVSEMPRVFLESKINLNVTLRSILSGIPLRCMDIMGAGGFLLSNYQPELAELFADGEEMVMFTGQEDLMEKAEYYLAHDGRRREIAMNGKKKVDAEYSFEKKLREIFEIVLSGGRRNEDSVI